MLESRRPVFSYASPKEWTIVIPHYTNAERTLGLIGAIRSASPENSNPEVVVVDDCSPDGSGKILAQAQETLDFKLIVNSKNLGFGPALNRGAAIAMGRLIAFSNSDIEFDAEYPLCNVLDALSKALAEPDIGAAMPLIFNSALAEIENLNEIWANRGLLWLKRKPKREVNADLEDSVLCGAFFAMRRQDFQKLGGFDPIFAPYFWEDVELGARIEAAGMRVVACGESMVLHRHDGSIGPSAGSKKKWEVMRSNQLKFTRMWGAEYGVKAGGFWRSLRAFRSFAKREFGLGLEYIGLR